VFMLQRCLCNLLCKCLPVRKASEGQTVADAPAPANGQPVGQTQPNNAPKPASGGGKPV